MIAIADRKRANINLINFWYKKTSLFDREPLFLRTTQGERFFFKVFQPNFICTPRFESYSSWHSFQRLELEKQNYNCHIWVRGGFA